MVGLVARVADDVGFGLAVRISLALLVATCSACDGPSFVVLSLICESPTWTRVDFGGHGSG